MQKKKLYSCCAAFALLIGGTVLLFVLLTNSALSGNRAFDFGVVSIPRPSSVLEHTFQLTNNTDHSLQLTNAVPTCGCTTANWPKEAVLPGEVLTIPVTLDMQRSQYRSSFVRLEFASGEIEVLHIEGAARFAQPLQCMPPIVKVVPNDHMGATCVLNVEWYEDTLPPAPSFETPSMIKITADSWKKSQKGNPNKGTPDKWTTRLNVILDGELQGGEEFTVLLQGIPPLHVPLEQTNRIERPALLPGGGPK